MFENYYTTPLEDWINSLYERHGIYSPEDLDEDIISDSLDILLVRTEDNSHYVVTDFFHMIVIDSRLRKIAQREEYFHECCHVLRHAGRQTMMNQAFLELQESQTKSFQLYAMMPITMINNLSLPNTERDIISLLAERFTVSTELAQMRLDQIKRRMFQSEIDNEIRKANKRRYPKSDPSNWSNETKALLQMAVQQKILKEGVF